MKIHTKTLTLISGGVPTDIGKTDFRKSIVSYEISRYEIENCLTDRLVHDLRVDPENPIIQAGPGSVIFMVSGFEDDPREIYEIPEFAAYMAALFDRTEVEGVLRIDCTATETFPRKSFPTFLYYNPHDSIAWVTLDVGPAPRDLYDAVENRFVAKGVSDHARLSLPPDTARLIVVCPENGELRRDGDHLLSGDVVIDYRAGEAAAN